ncbi:MAG: PilZ domain-containing protein [Candidatus Omnitrophica bacterium]|nr:PilZ domain-containing protein [Candidatus Omnitrophota bacterium]
MKNKKREDRRRTVRVRKPLDVEYSVSSRRTPSWAAGWLCDISETGMCMVSRPLPGRTGKLTVRIRVPIRPARTLTCGARIIAQTLLERSTALIRIEFDPMDDRTRRLLREYIAWLLIKERGVL